MIAVIAQRPTFYDFQEGLGWIWRELGNLISYLPYLVNMGKNMRTSFVDSLFYESTY